MNNLATAPANSPDGDDLQVPPPPPRQSGKEKPSQKGLLQYWYRIASPPEPGNTASFEDRELFRRGRTGSQITIVLFILIFISYPAAFAGSNSLLVVILTIDLFVLGLAMVLNRLRRVSIAGIMVVLCFTASPVMNILTTPNGVNGSTLPIFGLFVLPLMCAVSFFPPWWVFVVGVGNCLFAFYVLSFVKSTGELHEVLKTAFPGILTPIIISQVIVAIVAFLWVQGARQAIQRADRAEEIAKLEAIEIKRQEEQIAISKQLEEGIQQIITTMSTVVARNDFKIRVPLSQENILWRVSKSINNLLSRLQGFKQSEEELKRTHAVAAEVARHIREGLPIQLEAWTGTAFDPVIIEYNKQFRNGPGQWTKDTPVVDRIKP